MRRSAVLGVARWLSAALVLLWLLGPTVSADERVWLGLVTRAEEVLREAEQRYHRGDQPAAGDLARRALTLLEQADHQKPDDVGTARLAVQASIYAGDRPRAAAWLSRLASRMPNPDRDPNVLLARAQVLLYLDERPSQAVDVLDRMATLAPRSFERPRDLLLYAALLADGERCLRAGLGEAALKRYQRAVALARRLGDPRKERAARGNVGIALDRIGRREEAEVVFRALLSEDPEDPLWPWLLAHTLPPVGRFAEAASLYAQVAGWLAARPDQPPPLPEMAEAGVEAARCLVALAAEAPGAEARTARLVQARETLEAHLARRPGSVRGLFEMGCLLAAGFARPYEAIPLLVRAHELAPACEAPLVWLLDIHVGHPPPPSSPPGSVAASVLLAAWSARRAALEAEIRWGRAAREEERRRLRQASPDGRDGCP